jgi:hypothetical protein
LRTASRLARGLWYPAHERGELITGFALVVARRVRRLPEAQAAEILAATRAQINLNHPNTQPILL